MTNTAADIVNDIRAELGDIFAMMTWAEEEIAAAQRRHPERADVLWHSFRLLKIQDAYTGRMSVEQVYRSHAREILDRVAHGTDTRPATAAELVVGLFAAAETAPLRHEGFALTARMWQRAGLPDNDGFRHALPHLESLGAARLDRDEAEARRKCADPTRALTATECDGLHHGHQVACVFAPTPTLF